MNGQLNEKIARQIKDGFATDCIRGILTGYAKMKADNQYKPHWVEDKLTAHLARKIEESDAFVGQSIEVIPQAYIYNDDVIYGDSDPANSPRIDYKFVFTYDKWTKKKYYYHAEAKMLSEKTWQKPEGAKVRASESRDYYISGGINRYLSGYYKDGCMIGYVVNGTTLGVVSKINHLITRRGINPRIGILELDSSYASGCCYLSHNHLSDQIYPLRHIILQLV